MMCKIGRWCGDCACVFRDCIGDTYLCVYRHVLSCQSAVCLWYAFTACSSVIGLGKLLSNHVAVKTDRNVDVFYCKGLRQLQCSIVTDINLVLYRLRTLSSL